MLCPTLPRGRQIVAQNGGIKEIVNAMAAHADSMTLPHAYLAKYLVETHAEQQ